jgi:hypothetical protein
MRIRWRALLKKPLYSIFSVSTLDALSILLFPVPWEAGL